jgi:plastocyanin
VKNLIAIIVLSVGFLFTQEAVAQKVKTVKLEQTPGKFTQEKVKLKAGTPYVFEISNNGVDHAVGFVLAPKGKTEAEDHIKTAYVTEVVLNGETQTSNEVVLVAGEYVYFCPLNPTEQYNLTVK